MRRSIGLSLLSAALLVGCGSLGTPGTGGGDGGGGGGGGAATVPAQDYSVHVPFDPAPANAAQVGQWSHVVGHGGDGGDAAWPVLAIHSNLLPDGTVLTFGGNNYNGPVADGTYLNEVDVWDPATGTHTKVDMNGTALFCGGHVLLPSGKLLVTGGDDLTKLSPGQQYSQEWGVTSARTYDYKTKTWSKLPDMKERRWYPTNTVLPNGEVLAISGNTTGKDGYSALPEVYNSNSNSWRQLTGAQATTELYPRMFVLSSGRVINTGGQIHNVLYGNDFITGILDPSGAGKWYPFERDGDNFRRDYGPAVMYDTDKIAYFGGGGDDSSGNVGTVAQPPSADTLVIDASKIDPATGKGGTRFTNKMPDGPRRQHNATLLPDGSVLITGGTSAYGFTNTVYTSKDPQVLSGKVQAYQDATRKSALLWDPKTEQYSVLASMTVPRVYHSTALLLPDATVLVAGGGACGGEGDTSLTPIQSGCPDYATWRSAQVFKPPYLFKGPRPSIKDVPSSVTYGQTFTVQTDDAAGITAVNWIKLGNVTHSFNMGQRINKLTFTKASGSLSVTAPANANLATPGQYMLFILRNGVPSVARIMTIR